MVTKKTPQMKLFCFIREHMDRRATDTPYSSPNTSPNTSEYGPNNELALNCMSRMLLTHLLLRCSFWVYTRNE